MPLPPERISVKRRRQDDPVELLFLEESRTQNKKKRFTEFLFRRVQADQDVAQIPIPFSTSMSKGNQKQQSKSQGTLVPGIPFIRETLPGEEVKDLLQMKAAIKARSKKFEQTADEEICADGLASNSRNKHQQSTGDSTTSKVIENVRRFHLSREQARLEPFEVSEGIRQRFGKAKGRLATFVENPRGPLEPNTRVKGISQPIDRIVEVKTTSCPEKPLLGNSTNPEYLETSSTKQTFTQPFVKVTKHTAKTGRTIHSHPATWDLESDQLASELAALAFEIDPTGNHEPDGNAVVSKELECEPSDVEMEDDFIYETYVRLPRHASNNSQIGEEEYVSNVGVLVISEEDEGLWESFVESDDDAQWDEEDADSNAEDNPANDYPEDEVSSGDEFGYSAYDHRNNASEDEEYDIERDY